MTRMTVLAVVMLGGLLAAGCATSRVGGVMPPDKGWDALPFLYPDAVNSTIDHVGAALVVVSEEGAGQNTFTLVAPLPADIIDRDSAYPIWIREEQRPIPGGFIVRGWLFSPREVAVRKKTVTNGRTEIGLAEAVEATPEIAALAHDTWREICRRVPCNGKMAP